MIRSAAIQSDLILCFVGLTLLGIAGYRLARYEFFQHSSHPQRRFLNSHSTPNSMPARASVEVSGKLEIPRLGLSVLVVEGDEQQGLALGAVHLKETSPLGGPGNTVIAGHRDTAFWPLRNLAIGDLICLRGETVLTYRVRSIHVVNPADTSALAVSKAPELTLVTCYPFRHIGSSPQRFVVQASLLAGTPALTRPALTAGGA